MLVEACVDGVGSALGAAEGGAGRLELCDNLLEGGTTPSAGMIEVVRDRVSLPVFVLVRPRGGDFCYDADELEVMIRDIRQATALGADGIVLGALTLEGRIEVAVTRRLLEVARPLPVTFHRAFDHARDPVEALDDLLALGVDRVLTSGHESSALAGAGTIADLVRRSGDRLVVLAGGGIDEQSAAEVVTRTGVREVHVRGIRREESRGRRNPRVPLRRPVAGEDFDRAVTDPARIRRIVASVLAAGGATPSSRRADRS